MIQIGDSVAWLGHAGVYLVVEAERLQLRLRLWGVPTSDQPWVPRPAVRRLSEDEAQALLRAQDVGVSS